MRAAQTVTSRVHYALPEGLTTTQFAVLDALYHRGPLSQKELSTKLLTSSGNLTLVIANLKRKKLVSKTRSGKDRRYYTIRLSPKGRRFLAGFMPVHAERMASFFAVLSEAEQAQLGELCRRVGLFTAQFPLDEAALEQAAAGGG